MTTLNVLKLLGPVGLAAGCLLSCSGEDSKGDGSQQDVGGMGGAGLAGNAGAGAGGTAGSLVGGNAGTTTYGGATVGGASNGGASNGGASLGGASSGGSGATTGGRTSGGTSSGGASSGGATSGGASSGGSSNLEHFSFFVTSLEAMQRLSGSADGFGGDLRYGEADGLTGADKICSEIAESSMAGSSAKVWRAFLSVTAGPDGQPVNAKDRIGNGPWYDRLGRLVADNLEDLINTRPEGADDAIVNDLPNEFGVPNHQPDPTQGEVDNHDTLTGTNSQGELYANDPDSTCNDWTSSEGSGQPRCGHSWPRTGMGGGGAMGGGGMDMEDWMSALDEAGCAPGVNLVETGGPNPANPTVGSGGGYGGIYCFALTP